MFPTQLGVQGIQRKKAPPKPPAKQERPAGGIYIPDTANGILSYSAPTPGAPRTGFSLQYEIPLDFFEKKGDTYLLHPYYVMQGALLAFGKYRKGTPYQYGAKGRACEVDPRGTPLDCSGFVGDWLDFTVGGEEIPRSSDELLKLAKEQRISTVEPGDVIIRESSASPSGRHVGIYVGWVNIGGEPVPAIMDASSKGGQGRLIDARKWLSKGAGINWRILGVYRPDYSDFFKRTRYQINLATSLSEALNPDRKDLVGKTVLAPNPEKGTIEPITIVPRVSVPVPPEKVQADYGMLQRQPTREQAKGWINQSRAQALAELAKKEPLALSASRKLAQSPMASLTPEEQFALADVRGRTPEEVKRDFQERRKNILAYYDWLGVVADVAWGKRTQFDLLTQGTEVMAPRFFAYHYNLSPYEQEQVRGKIARRTLEEVSETRRREAERMAKTGEISPLGVFLARGGEAAWGVVLDTYDGIKATLGLPVEGDRKRQEAEMAEVYHSASPTGAFLGELVGGLAGFGATMAVGGLAGKGIGLAATAFGRIPAVASAGQKVATLVGRHRALGNALVEATGVERPTSLAGLIAEARRPLVGVSAAPRMAGLGMAEGGAEWTVGIMPQAIQRGATAAPSVNVAVGRGLLGNIGNYILRARPWNAMNLGASAALTLSTVGRVAQERAQEGKTLSTGEALAIFGTTFPINAILNSLGIFGGHTSTFKHLIASGASIAGFSAVDQMAFNIATGRGLLTDVKESTIHGAVLGVLLGALTRLPVTVKARMDALRLERERMTASEGGEGFVHRYRLTTTDGTEHVVEAPNAVQAVAHFARSKEGRGKTVDRVAYLERAGHIEENDTLFDGLRERIIYVDPSGEQHIIRYEGIWDARNKQPQLEQEVLTANETLAKRNAVAEIREALGDETVAVWREQGVLGLLEDDPLTRTIADRLALLKRTGQKELYEEGQKWFRDFVGHRAEMLRTDTLVRNVSAEVTFSGPNSRWSQRGNISASEYVVLKKLDELFRQERMRTLYRGGVLEAPEGLRPGGFADIGELYLDELGKVFGLPSDIYTRAQREGWHTVEIRATRIPDQRPIDTPARGAELALKQIANEALANYRKGGAGKLFNAVEEAREVIRRIKAHPAYASLPEEQRRLLDDLWDRWVQFEEAEGITKPLLPGEVEGALRDWREGVEDYLRGLIAWDEQLDAILEGNRKEVLRIWEEQLGGNARAQEIVEDFYRYNDLPNAREASLAYETLDTLGKVFPETELSAHANTFASEWKNRKVVADNRFADELKDIARSIRKGKEPEFQSRGRPPAPPTRGEVEARKREIIAEAEKGERSELVAKAEEEIARREARVKAGEEPPREPEVKAKGGEEGLPPEAPPEGGELAEHPRRPRGAPTKGAEKPPAKAKEPAPAKPVEGKKPARKKTSQEEGAPVEAEEPVAVKETAEAPTRSAEEPAREKPARLEREPAEAEERGYFLSAEEAKEKFNFERPHEYTGEDFATAWGLGGSAPLKLKKVIKKLKPRIGGQYARVVGYSNEMATILDTPPKEAEGYWDFPDTIRDDFARAGIKEAVSGKTESLKTLHPVAHTYVKTPGGEDYPLIWLGIEGEEMLLPVKGTLYKWLIKEGYEVKVSPSLFQKAEKALREGRVDNKHTDWHHPLVITKRGKPVGYMEIYWEPERITRSVVREIKSGGVEEGRPALVKEEPARPAKEPAREKPARLEREPAEAEEMGKRAREIGEGETIEEKIRTIEALAEEKSPEAIFSLARYLDDRSPEVAHKAIEALADTESLEALPFLEKKWEELGKAGFRRSLSEEEEGLQKALDKAIERIEKRHGIGQMEEEAPPERGELTERPPRPPETSTKGAKETPAKTEGVEDIGITPKQIAGFEFEVPHNYKGTVGQAWRLEGRYKPRKVVNEEGETVGYFDGRIVILDTPPNELFPHLAEENPISLKKVDEVLENAIAGERGNLLALEPVAWGYEGRQPFVWLGVEGREVLLPVDGYLYKWLQRMGYKIKIAPSHYEGILQEARAGAKPAVAKHPFVITKEGRPVGALANPHPSLLLRRSVAVEATQRRISAIEEELKSPSDLKRLNAVIELRSGHYPRLVPLLVRALEDKHTGVAGLAAHTLGEWKSREALPFLQKRLEELNKVASERPLSEAEKDLANTLREAIDKIERRYGRRQAGRGAEKGQEGPAPAGLAEEAPVRRVEEPAGASEPVAEVPEFPPAKREKKARGKKVEEIAVREGAEAPAEDVAKAVETPVVAREPYAEVKASPWGRNLRARGVQVEGYETPDGKIVPVLKRVVPSTAIEGGGSFGVPLTQEIHDISLRRVLRTGLEDARKILEPGAEGAEGLKKAVEESPVPTGVGLLTTQEDGAGIALVLTAQPHLTGGNYYVSVAFRFPGNLPSKVRDGYLRVVDETLEALSPRNFSWAKQKEASKGRWIEETTTEKGKPVVDVYFGKNVSPGEIRNIPLVIDIPHTPAALKWYEMTPAEFSQWLKSDEGQIVQKVWSTFLDRLESAFHNLLYEKLEALGYRRIIPRYELTERYSPESVLKTGKVVPLRDALKKQVGAKKSLAPLGTAYQEVPGGVEATTRLWSPAGDPASHPLIWKLWSEALDKVRKEKKFQADLIEDVLSTYFAPEANRRIERMMSIERDVRC